MIKRLTSADVFQIAALHKHCFPKDTLTLFSDKFLQVLYRSLLELSDVYAFGSTSDGKLIGFVLGVSDSKTAMRRAIFRRPLSFAIALLPKLTNHKLRQRIWETFFYGQKSATTPAELLVIAVDAAYRNRKVGTKLTTRLITTFRRQNIFTFHVSVYASNRAANRFYQKLGGHKSTSFYLYHKLWHVYEISAPFPNSLRKISIILPTYNETENILPLIKKILAVGETARLIPEILVVDDNSPDQTAQKVKQFYARDRRIKVIVRTQDRGLARSILTGIKHARHPLVAVMDTDFNHDPHLIPELITQLAKYDLAIGSRFVSGGGMEDRRRHYLSFLFNLYVRAFLQLPTRDSLSGFFATRKRLLTPYLNKSVFAGFGEYFIRLLFQLKRQQKTFSEVPVYYRLRHHGQRKSRFLQMFITYTQAVIKLKFNR